MRRLVNEDALMDRLAPLGFERVSLSGMAVREQIQLFAAASVIIGPHGAGMANVVFCEPETLVIELMSPTRTWPGFKVISGAVGARYAAYVAEAFDSAQTDLVGLGNEDFSVRVDTCVRFVEACIS
jgi:capsular polysaccharide biosynthesis protein